MQKITFNIDIKGYIYQADLILTDKQSEALKKRMANSKPTIPEVKITGYSEPYKK